MRPPQRYQDKAVEAECLVSDPRHRRNSGRSFGPSRASGGIVPNWPTGTRVS
ncbi:hypothetical protein [Microvirga sp. BSC39]|uniref:hypothetical protein n=1 Tax=Microvirga sp. BSC39 TaxID=1549810 RepID=UPI0013623F60|nr:hypothetical protein [Microvirga sp. BSC39]